MPSKASFLTLPSELRNAIYLYTFDPPKSADIPKAIAKPSRPLAVALQIDSLKDHREDDNSAWSTQTTRTLRLLQTCKQVHREAHLLALSRQTFLLTGASAHPEQFAARIQPLTDAQVSSLRAITLTARISQLRALNEAWAGAPFGDTRLRLEKLVLRPTRPVVIDVPFREIADLSQCHTLAYVLGETLKGLRHVRCLEVQNRACFEEGVWRMFYRSLVYRLWRWGGGKCGIRFESGTTIGVEHGEEQGMQWFRAYLQEGDEGNDVGVEVCRLIGKSGEYPLDPNGVR